MKTSQQSIVMTHSVWFVVALTLAWILDQNPFLDSSSSLLSQLTSKACLTLNGLPWTTLNSNRNSSRRRLKTGVVTDLENSRKLSKSIETSCFLSLLSLTFLNWSEVVWMCWNLKVGVPIYRRQQPITFKLVAARVSLRMAPVACAAAPSAPHGGQHAQDGM